MEVTVKLFSSLLDYLPSDAQSNSVCLSVANSTSAHQIIDRLGIPRGEAQVVMRNGEFYPIEERDNALSEGDSIAIWPSIQGG